MTKQILYWISISRRKERARVKDSIKTDLGGVSKPLGGSDFIGDDIVGGGKLVPQHHII